MRLAGKVAVVVPGTFGVGYDASLRFAAEGAKVVVGGGDAENGARVVGEVTAKGGAAHFVACDLLEDASVGRVVAAALERFGGLDAAFGCPDDFLRGLVVDQTAADLDYSLHYNVRSLFFLAKHAVPAMAARGGGSLVLLSSMYGLVTGSTSAAYEVSKGAVIGLAKALAERYAKDRVRVNCIAAGHVVEGRRDLRDEMPTSGIREEPQVERLSGFYPLGRLALPDDVARAAAFLASDDAAYMTGATLPVEGGFTVK
ncbi:MAG TPA: SDR family oxidoreductase [Planctomycetota bacterium]|nr:SDR family oxidoreductase [Planctomycetota bacterium]